MMEVYLKCLLLHAVIYLYLISLSNTNSIANSTTSDLPSRISSRITATTNIRNVTPTLLSLSTPLALPLVKNNTEPSTILTPLLLTESSTIKDLVTEDSTTIAGTTYTLANEETENGSTTIEYMTPSRILAILSTTQRETTIQASAIVSTNSSEIGVAKTTPNILSYAASTRYITTTRIPTSGFRKSSAATTKTSLGPTTTQRSKSTRQTPSVKLTSNSTTLIIHSGISSGITKPSMILNATQPTISAAQNESFSGHISMPMSLPELSTIESKRIDESTMTVGTTDTRAIQMTNGESTTTQYTTGSRITATYISTYAEKMTQFKDTVPINPYGTAVVNTLSTTVNYNALTRSPTSNISNSSITVTTASKTKSARPTSSLMASTASWTSTSLSNLRTSTVSRMNSTETMDSRVFTKTAIPNYLSMSETPLPQCRNLTEPDNGSVTYSSGTMYLSVATFACNKGYILAGGPTRTCLANKTWSDSDPSCELDWCANLKDPANGIVEYLSGWEHWSVATFSCNTGYSLLGNSTRVCKAFELWNESVPTCKMNDCGNLTAPAYGSVTYTNGTIYQSVATFSCHIGYSLIGSSIRRCQANETWSGNDPTCEIIDCGNLTAPASGLVTYTNGTAYQSVVTFSCHIGYSLIGSSTRRCQANDSWSGNDPTCEIIDCGNLTAPPYGSVTYTNGTIYQSFATFSCHNGYSLIGRLTRRCQVNETWRSNNPTCEIIDCGKLMDPINGRVVTENTSFGTTASYKCSEGYILQGRISRLCLSSGHWGGDNPKCIKEKKQASSCEAGTDSILKRYWNITKPGQIISKPCPNNFTGEVSRKCSENGQWLLPLYNCIRPELDLVEKQAQNLVHHPTEYAISKTLDSLVNLTNVTASPTTNNILLGGELEKVTDILNTIATLNTSVTENQTETFLETASNLLNESNTESWKSVSQTGENKGAQTVLKVIDNFAESISMTLNNSKKASITIAKPNLVLQVGKVESHNVQSIVFPKRRSETKATENWVDKSKSGIHLNKNSIAGQNIRSYTSAFYRNLSGILPSKSNGQVSKGQKLNSAVLAFSLNPKPKHLNPPIEIVFEHFQGHLTDAVCSFWSFNRSTNGSGWASSGCRSVSSNSSMTICNCDHLTNFAILMSPFVEHNVVDEAIDIISTVGCVVSIVGLLATIFFHLYLWRYVKSDRVIILLNLCLALTIAYIIFLGGVDRTENKVPFGKERFRRCATLLLSLFGFFCVILCTRAALRGKRELMDACQAVAILLQYIYLVVFFLMLAEGIEITFMVIYVFATRSRIKWLLPLAWGVPMVIVGISLGATNLNGYGTKDFCWLSVKSGLIWAFVGPALVIILINVILLIFIIRATFGAKSVKEKSRNARVRTGVRCLSILLPLMGLTWVIGIFYVNEKETWIQYAFSVCNALQGLFIFLFHCLLNKQIRNAVRQRKLRYSSSTSTAKTKLTLTNSSSQNKDENFMLQDQFRYRSSSRLKLKQNSDAVETFTRKPQDFDWIDIQVDNKPFPPHLYSRTSEQLFKIKRPALFHPTTNAKFEWD